jgi:serine/threonine protein kinase
MVASTKEVDKVLSDLKDVAPINSGGQKEVHRALHPKWGECVLKIGKSGNPASLERARREITVQGTLTTDYYPEVHFFGIKEGKYYVVEQLIESKPLSDMIGDFSDSQSCLSLISDIANGLSPLWEMNIAHRDVKPDNILITPEGRPKIIDLGILRDPSADSLTLSLAPLGPCTPAYAAPEQLMNQKLAISPRTDQFPLGIILFQLLASGIHPYDPAYVGAGESIPHNIMERQWSDKALRSKDINTDVIGLINKCLGFHPYERFRNYNQLNDTIRKCMGG